MPLEQDVMTLFRRVAEMERRLRNVVRYGKVKEVDVDKGLVRVEDGGLLSGWMPWHDSGGAIKTWTPPSVGQVAVMFSPSGDIAQGIAFAGQFSNDNPAPHDKAAQYVMEIGSTRIIVEGNKTTIKADTILFDGVVNLGGEGGQLVHRKGDADSDGDTAVGSATRVYAV